MSLASRFDPIATQAFSPRSPVVDTDRVTFGATTGSTWRSRYSRALLISDLGVLLVALGLAQIANFGAGSDKQVSGLDVHYQALGMLLAAVWWVSLQLHQTRSDAILGHGPEEYQRVVVATFRLFATLALLSVAFKVDASRGYLATAFPLGLLGLLLARKFWRGRLHRERIRGGAMANVLVIGGERSAAQLAQWFTKNPAAGYRVTGEWAPQASGHDLDAALHSSKASTVVVTDTEQHGDEILRELIWQLDGTGIDLVVSPNVLDVASSRLRLHDVSGMPMLHVSEPQYAGAARWGKIVFDRVGAALIVLALAPVLIISYLVVRLTSPGPAFYRQERVGRDGTPFSMIKFRSMRVGADAEFAKMLADQGKSLAQLPKLKVDPRVTPIGGFIRRFSIDELPQLFNVLNGDMSLVGPRPQRDFEVEQYDHIATRRLRVRPGMTGLWQVSGRSDLSYEEAIRLDVHYVENWSITGDMMILWRTLRAVLASDGAY